MGFPPSRRGYAALLLWHLDRHAVSLLDVGPRRRRWSAELYSIGGLDCVWSSLADKTTNPLARSSRCVDIDCRSSVAALASASWPALPAQLRSGHIDACGPARSERFGPPLSPCVRCKLRSLYK